EAELWLWRRARGAGGRDGGADLQCEPADGREPDHRGVRGRGDRRHGLDPGGDHHRLRARADRGIDQGVLPGSVEHGDLRGHGHRPVDPAGRPVRTEHLKMVAAAQVTAPATATRSWSEAIAFAAMLVLLVVLPAFVYPVFLMK